jgi:hypothetical protein
VEENTMNPWILRAMRQAQGQRETTLRCRIFHAEAPSGDIHPVSKKAKGGEKCASYLPLILRFSVLVIP